jgi:hypothetical protein
MLQPGLLFDPFWIPKYAGAAIQSAWFCRQVHDGMHVWHPIAMCMTRFVTEFILYTYTPPTELRKSLLFISIIDFTAFFYRTMAHAAVRPSKEMNNYEREYRN